jgi:hypothetical protein
MATPPANTPALSNYFDKINKVSVNVIIKTDDNIIIGDLYIRPQNRIMDELDHADTFVALTNAIVLDNTGKVRFKTHFMTINTQKIVYVIPKDELVGKENPEGTPQPPVTEV